jgi:hypothetical protein
VIVILDLYLSILLVSSWKIIEKNNLHSERLFSIIIIVELELKNVVRKKGFLLI